MSEIVRSIQPPGQAEVAHQRLANSVQQDVPWFKVAMENALGMRVLHGSRDFCHERDALPRVLLKRRSRFQQAAPQSQLHAKKRNAILAFAYIVDRQNVWMIQARCGLGFTPEARQGLAGVSVITQEPFDGDDAPRITLPRAIDHP